jgi:hypothetical protein
MRIVNCEDALNWKVTALMKAGKEQVALRQALDAKDAELAKV